LVVCIDKEYVAMRETKRIKVSGKRQITIPKEFYNKLNLGDEVECTIDEENGQIIIRPAIREDYFSEFILSDLIERGYEGKNLLNEFVKMKRKVRPAVERIIEEADQVAVSAKGTGDEETEEIFADVKD